MDRLKRRANLLYSLRRKGVRCHTKKRLIFIPCGEDPSRYKQAVKLCHEYNFVVQFFLT